MGVVYRATHVGLEHAVALKVLGGPCASDPVVVRRFIREARTISQLGHQHAIAVYDLGQIPDGRPYMAMEWMDAGDLGELMADGHPVDPLLVVALLRGPGSALDAAHARGVVHRDVKPENLLCKRNARGDLHVKLADFGLACFIEPGQTYERLTKTGVILGTPAYIAPEAVTRQRVDGRADVYALATVAFEMLTGTVPFDDDSVVRLLSVKTLEDPPSLSEASGRSFPEAVENVLAHGLAREPEERFDTAGAFLTALTAAAAKPAVPEPAQPEPSRRATEPLPLVRRHVPQPQPEEPPAVPTRSGWIVGALVAGGAALLAVGAAIASLVNWG